MDPNLIYLAQTDTTVGLLSQDNSKLVSAKKRTPDKPFIKAFDSLKTLKSHSKIEKNHRKLVRKSSRTTFITGGKSKSFRVVVDDNHKELVSKFGWLYTTSANESTKEFDIAFAINNSDAMVLTNKIFKTKKSSAILKLLKKKIKKIRA